jgi:hypothetical protein
MWKWIKKHWKDIFLVATILLMVATIVFHFVHPKEITKTEIFTDTIVKVEYKEIEVPKEKIKYVDRIKLDTLYLHDTIFIKEQINYRDSIASIWVSGYHPEIDSIHYTIPEKTIYVDKIVEVQKKESFWKNRFVITAGFSTQYGLVHKQWDVGPYVGIGVRIF